MKNSNLSIENKIALFTAFGAVILSVILHIGILQWNKPDIRYEEGSYYHSGNFSITSLRLQNYGHSDAEDVVISAYFPWTITDIASSDPAVKLEIISGGVGNEEVVFSINRLVPSQISSIYFSTEPIGNKQLASNQEYILSITYNGGIGKTGLPFYINPRFLSIISLILIIVVVIGSAYIYIKTIEVSKNLTKIREDLDVLEEATELIGQEIIEAKEKGVQIPDGVEELHEKVKIALYGPSGEKFK